MQPKNRNLLADPTATKIPDLINSLLQGAGMEGHPHHLVLSGMYRPVEAVMSSVFPQSAQSTPERDFDEMRCHYSSLLLY